MAMTEERERPTDVGAEAPDARATAGAADAEGALGAEGAVRASTAPGASGAEGADLGRRDFFRVFSRDAFQAAAGVVGAADAVRRGTSAAAVELLGLTADPVAGADRLAGAVEAERPVPILGGIGGRSPYRFEGSRMLVLDQRRLPSEAIEIVCSTGAEIAACIRDGAVLPGPVLAPLAAYAMAMAAERNVASRPYVRSSTLRGTANALRNARTDSAAIEVALARLAPIWQVRRARAGEAGHAQDAPDTGGAPDTERARDDEEAQDTADAGDTYSPADPSTWPDGAAIAAAMRAEADALAMAAMIDLSALVEAGAAILPQPEERPLEVVTIGATGPLSAGVIGTAMGVMAAVAAGGRPIHAWVLEGRPGRTGARIGAAELRALDVPATVIADGAIGWLFRERTIDAVLVAADRIAENGDVAGFAGTAPLAVMAGRHDVPVYVCAPRAAITPRIADGTALPIVVRSRHDLLAGPGEQAPEGIDARVPLGDVTPAELVTGFVTEAGLLRPPFDEAGD